MRSRGFRVPTRNGVVPLKSCPVHSGVTDSRHPCSQKSNDLEGFLHPKGMVIFPRVQNIVFCWIYAHSHSKLFCFSGPWLHESRPRHKNQTKGSPCSILKADSLDTQHLLFPKQKAMGFSTKFPKVVCRAQQCVLWRSHAHLGARSKEDWQRLSAPDSPGLHSFYGIFRNSRQEEGDH